MFKKQILHEFNNFSKVGEIFLAAGNSYSQLGKRNRYTLSPPPPPTHTHIHTLAPGCKPSLPCFVTSRLLTGVEVLCVFKRKPMFRMRQVRNYLALWIHVSDKTGCFIIDLQDANKKQIEKKFLCILLFEGTFTSFFKIKSQKEFTKQQKSRFFLLFLLNDRRIQIRIQTSV